LISTDGTLYLLDPLTGEDREKPVSLGAEFIQKNILDAKLFDSTLILRAEGNQFYWISNLQNPVPSRFEYVPSLRDAAITDYTIIPKGSKNSTAIELLVADPIDGIWKIKENQKPV
jgi:hypothetical protein